MLHLMMECCSLHPTSWLDESDLVLHGQLRLHGNLLAAIKCLVSMRPRGKTEVFQKNCYRQRIMALLWNLIGFSVTHLQWLQRASLLSIDTSDTIGPAGSNEPSSGVTYITAWTCSGLCLALNPINTGRLLGYSVNILGCQTLMRHLFSLKIQNVQ